MIHESNPTRDAARKTRVWAVLGGIASGKSALGRMLAGDQGLVLDADLMVAKLYASPDFQKRVALAFGPGVVSTSGAIDRAALARRVFDDAPARQLLESLIHPPVREEIRAGLEAARRRGVPRVVLDVPLLLENEALHHLPAECEALIFIDAPPEIREARAQASRGWPSGEVARREAQQLPLAAKRARAQHVIVNDGDLAQLDQQVRSLLRTLDPGVPSPA
ncbi:MAG: dephospho-CoA kinase [Planctomycetota bacterium]